MAANAEGIGGGSRKDAKADQTPTNGGLGTIRISGADNLIENCVNRGSVSSGTVGMSQGNDSAAGIAAFNGGVNTVIRNCHNEGTVYANVY